MLMQKVRNSRWRYIDRVIDKSFTKNKVISAIQSVLSMLIVSKEFLFRRTLIFTKLSLRKSHKVTKVINKIDEFPPGVAGTRF